MQWRRVEDTETGAQYSVTSDQVGTTWRELPDQPGADAHGWPLPTKTKAQVDAEAIAAAAADATSGIGELSEAGLPFDPGSANVADVLTYLEGVDDTERQRVIAAESAGKNRVTITGWSPQT